MLSTRRSAIVLVGAASALTLGLGLGFGSPALATAHSAHYSATDVKTVITGGNATSLSICGNLAQHGYDITQIAKCKNVDSLAQGGDVNLTDVSIKVYSPHSRAQTFTNVSTVISGGDATAVSACINAAVHSSDVVQKTTCDNVSSAAFGGNVTLSDVNITVK